MLCVVLQGPTYEQLVHQVQIASKAADCLEVRLDKLNSIDVQSLRKVCSCSALPIIFTLRGQQGGGTQEEQMSLIRSVLTLQPSYCDLEWTLPRSFIEDTIRRFPRTKIILSHHDFSGTPCDLDSLYHEMKKIPVAFYKIAVMTHTCSDALKLLLFLREHRGNLCVIGMGSCGEITRIAGPIFGSPFTYAALDETNLSAPGQFTADVLLNRYHFKDIDERTVLCGLIGDPVEQSISHVTHNEFFNKNDLNAVYVKMRVPPNELKKFLSLCRQLPFRGLSVTLPLKEAILSFLDEIDEKAQKIGAVNTLVFDHGKIKGYNTDCLGALDAVEKKMKVDGKKIVIIGAGGAARAIAYEALLRGAHVTIINRHIERARQCAHEFGCRGKSLDEMCELTQEGYDILINATSSRSPISMDNVLSNTLVMDINVNPKETPFLAEAQAKGCEIVYGIDMFYRQAQEQFKLWFKP